MKDHRNEFFSKNLTSHLLELSGSTLGILSAIGISYGTDVFFPCNVVGVWNFQLNEPFYNQDEEEEEAEQRRKEEEVICVLSLTVIDQIPCYLPNTWLAAVQAIF